MCLVILGGLDATAISKEKVTIGIRVRVRVSNGVRVIASGRVRVRV